MLATLTNYLDDKVTEQLDPFQLFKAHLQKPNCFYIQVVVFLRLSSGDYLSSILFYLKKLFEVGINILNEMHCIFVVFEMWLECHHHSNVFKMSYNKCNSDDP